jgi:AcrR family transcriptional regulator
MKRTRTGQTADRLVEATVELIAEKGGSQDVTLRAVADRVGCAHTNAYNYFEDFDALRWAAFAKAIDTYAEHLEVASPARGPANELLRSLIERIVAFPHVHTGLFRFITTDDLDMESMPDDLMETVARLRYGYAYLVTLAAGLPADSEEGRSIADIVLAYLTGESLNAINERVLPDDDISSRVVDNALRVFALLVMEAHSLADTTPPDPSRVIEVPGLDIHQRTE